MLVNQNRYTYVRMTSSVNKKTQLIIFFIFLVTLSLINKIKWLPTNNISFAYEQVRDAVASQNIFLQKKLTLIGPTTDVDGIFAGPLSYYFNGFIYSLFGKNPINLAVFYILFNLTLIPIVFYVSKKLFNETVGIISSILFAFSFEVSSYGLWLSNPPFSLPFIILGYFLVYWSFAKNQKILPLAFFLTGIAVQSEIALITSLLPYTVIYCVYGREKLKLTTILFSFLSLLISLINFPLFEIRHNFLMSKRLFEFLFNGGISGNLVELLVNFSKGLIKEFTNVLFPLSHTGAAILSIILLAFLLRKILQQKKAKEGPWFFILVWILSTFFMFFVRAPFLTAEYAFIGTNAPITILASVFIVEIGKKSKLFAGLILSLLVLGNITAWNKNYPDPRKRILDSQRGMMLKDELAVIDYTYKQANGKPFSVSTVTFPLYISPLWDYLYSWYGQENYHYLPVQDTKQHFLIIDVGREDSFEAAFEMAKEKTIKDLNAKSILEETRKFGGFTVEKRNRKN